MSTKNRKKVSRKDGVRVGAVIRGLRKVRKSGRRYIPAPALRLIVVKLVNSLAA